MLDWRKVVSRLKTFPKGVNVLNPPCPSRRAAKAAVPAQIKEMLRCFNGAELFVDALPFVTIFGLSTPRDTSGSDWFLDRFSAKWRRAMNRPNDWVIALSNYGAIFVLDDADLVREWDSNSRKWIGKAMSFEDWIRRMLSEGEAYLGQN